MQDRTRHFVSDVASFTNLDWPKNDAFQESWRCEGTQSNVIGLRSPQVISTECYFFAEEFLDINSSRSCCNWSVVEEEHYQSKNQTIREPVCWTSLKIEAAAAPVEAAKTMTAMAAIGDDTTLQKFGRNSGDTFQFENSSSPPILYKPISSLNFIDNTDSDVFGEIVDDFFEKHSKMAVVKTTENQRISSGDHSDAAANVNRVPYVDSEIACCLFATAVVAVDVDAVLSQSPAASFLQLDKFRPTDLLPSPAIDFPSLGSISSASGFTSASS